MTNSNTNTIPKTVHNLIGMRFNRYTVIAYSHAKKAKYGTRHYWVSKCDCGTIKTVRADQLKNNNTRSCGCYNRDVSRELRIKSNTKHGMSKTPVYYIWLAMRRRCHSVTDRQYEDYGGRGIGVCDRWKNSFEAFHEDMGNPPDGYTIERLDNNSGYSPGNCIWATMKEQCLNRRSNHLVTIDGETKTITEWSNEYGINPRTVFGRIHRGRDPIESITTPVIKRGTG
jgi:hypothetical protein